MFLVIFKSSILFETHTLLDKLLRVLQVPTHLSNLTAHGYTTKCYLIVLSQVNEYTLTVNFFY